MIILLLASFSQLKLKVFHWSLSDSKSPKSSRTFINILADHNSAVVWMVSIIPLISSFASIFSKP